MPSRTRARQLGAVLAAAGYVLLRGGNHRLWRHPGGAIFVLVSTPRDPGTQLKKVRSAIRRAEDRHQEARPHG